MTYLAITGNVQKRFVHAGVLLQMLDPVRGEPTAHGLDHDELGQIRERFLKRKFLDSFALVCAAHRGGDSVSAASMEESQPQGTVIRIASNTGVDESTLIGVQSIVNDLMAIAIGGSERVETEAGILLKIIQVDISRIRGYINELRGYRDRVISSRSAIEKRVLERWPDIELHCLEQFLEWLDDIFRTDQPDTPPEPDTLVGYVRRAQQAKRDYLELLIAMSTQAEPHPRWVSIILKLGRYGIAARAFVQLAVEFPVLFDPMIVESVPAPAKTKFPRNDASLSPVLGRLVGNERQQYFSRLSRIWDKNDLERHFQRQCPTSLVVHAEIQLVGFYDLNPQRMPTFRFIGVSKKSCYLCDRFLAIHPQSFSTSACHQKLYISWTPPPTTNNRIYSQYKDLTGRLTKMMEDAGKQDLQHRLGNKQRPAPAESSVGVSLSGLTEAGSVQGASRTSVGTRINLSHIALERNASAAWKGKAKEEPGPSSFVKAVRNMQSNEASVATHDAMSVFTLDGQPDWHDEAPSPFSDMVLHFTRGNDLRSQDIVRIAEIVDYKSEKPSWAKLVETLGETDPALGLAFEKEKDFLVVENRITVNSERQLIACLQYLRNVNKLNAEVLVCSREASDHSTKTAAVEIRSDLRKRGRRRLKWAKALNSFVKRSGTV